MAEDILKAIKDGARKLRKAEFDLEKKEAECAALKASIKEMQEKTLVGLMQEADCMSFELGSGFRIERTSDTYANISKERKPAAFAWLIKNKFGGLIKNEIDILFAKGKEKEAKAMLGVIKKAGLPCHVEAKQSIHHQTLQAFVREQLEKGKELDAKLFGIHTVDKAVIVAPKANKKA